MRGSHCIKTWSSTQKNVTLSSAEAELVAAVKASAELIGAVQMEREWGHEVSGEVYVDSSAALAVVGRKGNGKLRHVKVGHLWIQEKRSSGELKYKKVHGEQNPSDAMTKYLTGKRLDELIRAMSNFPREGRAMAGLTLNALAWPGVGRPSPKGTRPRGSARAFPIPMRIVVRTEAS